MQSNPRWKAAGYAVTTSFAAMLFTAPVVRAQAHAPAAHSHAAPHGGEIVEAGGHHVEFKADSTGAAQVWLLDEKQQTVSPPPGATLTLVAGQGAPVGGSQ